MTRTHRATVVGSGPNGLAAAVTLARAGFSVTVLEAAASPGGAARTEALTLPGFQHDVGSAVHPIAATSPFFRAFGLADRLEWLVPEISYAHPLDDGEAAIAWRSLDRTADALGVDGGTWRRILRPLARHRDELVASVSGSLLRPPAHPLTAARFAARAVQLGSSAGFATSLRTEPARALLAGVFAHSNTALPSVASAAAGLFLAAHAHLGRGWPLPVGGAQAITDALLADLRAHGGQVRTGVTVSDLEPLRPRGPGELLLLDTAPDLLLTLPDLPARFARAIRRYRRGPALAKVDFALSGPVPWQNPLVARAPTVHLGGTYRDIATAERAVSGGQAPPHPFAIVVQPSVQDASRAPAGCHTLWAYTHVPLRSRLDPTERITAQLERFAPGFADRVLASAVVVAGDRERVNPADIGGDALGGAVGVRQLIARPVLARSPWRTGVPGVYLGSAATSPGPGVSGMPGWLAAQCGVTDITGVPVQLRDLFGQAH